VRDDGGVACALGHVDGFDGLGEGADLVELNEDGVAGAHLDALRQALRVGDEEIVADDLDFLSKGLGEFDIAVPVVLVEAVFDGDNGVLVHQLV